jgi:hypothetical protein
MTGVTTDSGLMAPAGGIQGTLGDGDAPAAPFTRGGFPQAATKETNSREMPWRYLIVCDIIPNTLPMPVLLIYREVLCDARLHYIWRFVSTSGANDEV